MEILLPYLCTLFHCSSVILLVTVNYQIPATLNIRKDSPAHRLHTVNDNIRFTSEVITVNGFLGPMIVMITYSITSSVYVLLGSFLAYILYYYVYNITLFCMQLFNYL